MAYTNKTKNYELPQWTPENKPERRDFNEAFDTIDTQLGNKANRIQELNWSNVEFSNGFAYSNQDGALSYAKDENGWVYLNGLFWNSNPEAVKAGIEIARLPKGFRPGRLSFAICAGRTASSGIAWATFVEVTTEGSIRFAGNTIPSDFPRNMGVCIDTMFLATA